ncbi:MAG: lysophospholipid acyltransferase family protein [Phycisphaerae bacterium]
MKAQTGPLAWLFYMVVRVVFAVMQMFPIDWNLRSARGVAALWPIFMRRHRDRAVEALRRSFGQAYPPHQIERVADRCLESWAMFAVEAICLPRLIHEANWPRYIRLKGFRPVLGLMLSGRGVIYVTAHYGSFELSAHLLAILGFDVVTVMRPLDNAYLNAYLVQSRRMRGLTMLDKKGAAASAERILGEGRMLAFAGDQDAGRKGLFVDFFGRPASTYKSIGLLAMATGCPIVVAYTRRLGHAARYEVGVQRVIEPHEWEKQQDPLRWITQTYTSAMEAFVREAPEQYLWIHRRWKSQPRRPAVKL